MKKTLIIAIAALALLASCAEKTDSTGYEIPVREQEALVDE